MNKLSMPGDDLVERGMTDEERRRRQEQLRKWREQEGTEDESAR